MKNFTLVPVPKAKNLDAISWTDGYMLVRFKGRPDRYVYGPEIPEDAKDKILANPYPDRLFSLIVVKRFKCHKIGSKP